MFFALQEGPHQVCDPGQGAIWKIYYGSSSYQKTESSASLIVHLQADEYFRP